MKPPAGWSLQGSLAISRAATGGRPVAQPCSAAAAGVYTACLVRAHGAAQARAPGPAPLCPLCLILQRAVSLPLSEEPFPAPGWQGHPWPRPGLAPARPGPRQQAVESLAVLRGRGRGSG